MLNQIKVNIEKQGYRFTGNHSAVKICEWTKKSLLDKGVCYKEKFYNIKSHQCCQMTPSLICPNSCTFCWRTMSPSLIDKEIKEKIDNPKQIIENCIKEQRKLLVGFKGNSALNWKKYKEAQNPQFFAISLSGEPTLYNRLRDLIKELDKRKINSFLVTNGQFPEALKKLNKLPTQLYVSLDAPTKEIYKRLDRPILKDYWKRLTNTLELLSSLNTRTVLRITAIKEINMCNEKEYSKLIKKADPNFIEVKGYMYLGQSRKNLKYENMPLHKDIQDFSKKISDLTGLKIIDQDPRSRVCLLAEKDFKNRKLKF
jgi:tRNA wybutosine-synthesizing protein 1